MATVDGDGISEIFQANGAGGFAGEVGSRVGCSHGAPQSTESFIFFVKGVSLPTTPKGLGWAEPGLSLGWGRGGDGLMVASHISVP